MTDLAVGGKFHLASPPPSHCSSCFGQYTERRHVDFSANYDGPVLQNVVGGVMTSIDELIICETCLTHAAKLIGLEPPGESQQELEQLRERLVEMSERHLGALAYIATLEKAQEQRESLTPRKQAPRKG